jgi:hypothetical protein
MLPFEQTFPGYFALEYIGEARKMLHISNTVDNFTAEM